MSPGSRVQVGGGDDARGDSPGTGSTTATQIGPPSFRRDIQGLRAVAVIVVIADHLFSWPAGGFIGVDVFFVISGFLITGLMLREHERSGRISLVGFYQHRARRILPAATVCIVVVVAVSFLIYRSARFAAVRADAIWSFLFASNWHFAAVGTDYWASDAVSPLQHFWSLAVEEQFYVVWPLMLIVLLGMTGRRRALRGPRAATSTATVIAVVVLASFLWALYESSTSPSWAYFSTWSRAWELGVGSLLAVASTWLTRIPGRVRPTMSYLGLALIGAGLFMISPASSFPGPWAALPVAGAAAVIAAGVGRQSGQPWILTNRLAFYVGKVSYSLYLWHFPVIILTAAVVEAATPRYFVIALTLTAALGIGSFYLVEDPVRRSTWLNPGARKQRRRSQRRRGASIGYAGLAVLTVITLGAAIYVIQDPRTAQVPAAVRNNPVMSASAATVPAAGSDPQSALSAEIDAALAQTEWPDLQPSIDDVTSSDYDGHGCGDPQGAGCVSNPAATKTAYVLGDSTAFGLALTAKQALWTDYTVSTASLASCPVPPIVKDYPNEELAASCPLGRQKAMDEIVAMHPDVVFLVSAYLYGSLSSGAVDDAAAAEWGAALRSLLPQITANAGKVILVSSPPYVEKGLASCATKSSRPAACEDSVTPEWLTLSETEAAAAEDSGAAYWDTISWFCSADKRCPSFIGTTPVRADNIHLTTEFATKLAPVFKEGFDTIMGG